MTAELRPIRQARVILASASPRRASLLAQIGVSYEIDPSRIEEVVPPGLAPAGVVEILSRQKAEDVASRRQDADLVLGADTVVALGDRILGKPKDRAEAIAMLAALQGRWHQVYTGFTLVAPRHDRIVTGHAVTEVKFRSMESFEVEAYVATGEPMDKAGAYGIQELGGLFVSEIRGDYPNVVGLPIASVDAAWRELGWSVL